MESEIARLLSEFEKGRMTRRQLVQSRGLAPSEDKGGFQGPMKEAPFQSFHVRDPDGWDLQISNQTPEKHE